MNTVKLKRQLSGLTQLQFSQKINIPLRTYKRYEADENSNEYREPKISTAIKIADELGVRDLRDLWDYTNSS